MDMSKLVIQGPGEVVSMRKTAETAGSGSEVHTHPLRPGLLFDFYGWSLVGELCDFLSVQRI